MFIKYCLLKIVANLFYYLYNQVRWNGMKRKIIVISLLILGVSSLLLGAAYQNKVEVENKNKLDKEAALKQIYIN